MRVTPHASPLLVLVAIGVALLAMACGSSTDSKSTDPTSPSPTDASSGTTRPTADPTIGGQLVAAAAVTCHLAKREQGGIIATDEGRTEAPCEERHNEESFTLAGTQELDDCYRAVAASSDVTIGPDSFDPTKLDFDDARIIGHTFATAPDGTPGLACAIDLRDDRSGLLLSGG